jgi:hypothetical protein
LAAGSLVTGNSIELVAHGVFMQRLAGSSEIVGGIQITGNEILVSSVGLNIRAVNGGPYINGFFATSNFRKEVGATPARRRRRRRGKRA